MQAINTLYCVVIIIQRKVDYKKNLHKNLLDKSGVALLTTEKQRDLFESFSNAVCYYTSVNRVGHKLESRSIIKEGHNFWLSCRLV